MCVIKLPKNLRFVPMELTQIPIAADRSWATTSILMARNA